MPNLKGRQKDSFKLINKLLTSESPKLLTLRGLPGIGKSALVASVLEYIDERHLLKGGSIYINARNISSCEIFIRNFNQILISENPIIFGNAREHNMRQQEPIQTLNLILSKISIIEGDILIVFDNVEEIISNERNELKMLLSMMLTRVRHLKILLTTRYRLTSTVEFKEDIIILNKLNNQ